MTLQVRRGALQPRRDPRRARGSGQTLPLIFAVIDTGPGIPANVRQILFQPFAQDVCHVPGEGGTGLGLAITQAFVQLMGGTIEVQTQLDQGSTFRVQLNLGLGKCRPSIACVG